MCSRERPYSVVDPICEELRSARESGRERRVFVLLEGRTDRHSDCLHRRFERHAGSAEVSVHRGDDWQVRETNPPRSNIKLGPRDVIEHAVHQVVAHQGSGGVSGVGDVGGKASFPHSEHHRPKRNGCVVSDWSVGHSDARQPLRLESLPLLTLRYWGCPPAHSVPRKRRDGLRVLIDRAETLPRFGVDLSQRRSGYENESEHSGNAVI